MATSTPRSRTRSMSAVRLTVQTWTSLPAAWASATNSGSDRSSPMLGPTAVAAPCRSSRRTGRSRLPISCTVGTPGANSAIRRTASWEKLIIRTAGLPAHSTGRLLPSSPKRRRQSTSASSTLRAWRGGGFVSVGSPPVPGGGGGVFGLDGQPHRPGGGGDVVHQPVQSEDQAVLEVGFVGDGGDLVPGPPVPAAGPAGAEVEPLELLQLQRRDDPLAVGRVLDL